MHGAPRSHRAHKNLLSWLLQKKSEGYRIVGLEQTSSSVPLHEIQFADSGTGSRSSSSSSAAATATGKSKADVINRAHKTVLLLGKEREGIPMQYLQAVDRCIEIPQFGMIRSLNVHVSGAIAIWEYTKQGRLL